MPDAEGRKRTDLSTTPPWSEWETLIRRDPGGRGVASFVYDGRPLGFGDLERAALDLARSARRVALITGFCIVDADPPSAETDGPPGTLFLARALGELGVNVVLLSDAYGVPLLDVGCSLWNLTSPDCEIVEVPIDAVRADAWTDAFLDEQLARGLTHVVAIERAGPSHTFESVSDSEGPTAADRFAREVPPEHRGVHHNMRGTAIDRVTAPAGQIFEQITARRLDVATIGVGDGGNELGMGKFPWTVLREAVRVGPGACTACRIKADHTIVAGVSDWGAYALALGVAVLRGRADLAANWTGAEQRRLIERLVAAGAVDGVAKQRAVSVDGLAMEEYLNVLESLRSSALQCGMGVQLPQRQG